MGMYVLRLVVPLVSLWKRLYEPLKKKWFLTPILVTFVITVDIVITGKIDYMADVLNRFLSPHTVIAYLTTYKCN